MIKISKKNKKNSDESVDQCIDIGKTGFLLYLGPGPPPA
jgi:hypothetical protein